MVQNSVVKDSPSTMEIMTGLVGLTMLVVVMMTYKHTLEVRIIIDYCVVTVIGSNLAPNFTPTNLTVLHKDATSITISWTAVNAVDADGYVVYLKPPSDAYDDPLFITNRTAVDVGNTKQYTLIGVIPECTYSITVRAYQDLLGPESDVISETFEGENHCHEAFM